MPVRYLKFILLCLFLSSTFSYGQSPRLRRADSLKTFFIGSWGPFDEWPRPDPRDDRFGRIGDVRPFRYHNLSDSLDFNAESRRFWDYPSHRPARKHVVLGGEREPHLDVLIIEPVQLFQALLHAFYLRFEFERHEQQTAENEYFGFLERPGLTGQNVKAPGATFPSFLPSSVRASDTMYNAVRLGLEDPAGVFADEMWQSNLFMSEGDSPYIGRAGHSRKMLMRLRVRIDQTISTSLRRPAVLCIITRTEKDWSGRIRTIAHDTIRVNSAFKHVNKGFDTIDIPFIRDASNSEDRTRKMYFSFYWPKKVRATFDYMELLTAQINADDKEEHVRVSNGNFGSDAIALGWAAANSGEAFLAKEPDALGALISRIKRDYLGHVNYLRIGDEMPISETLPFKRLVKLVRDSTNGMIEVLPFTTDSAIGWYGKTLPNSHVFTFEGARLGLVDTSLYADPKILFFDPYVFANYIPLPKRTATSDRDSLEHWEDRHIVSGTYFKDGLSYPKVWNHYSPQEYLMFSQYKSHADYLSANREAMRWTLRQQNGSRFGIDWQAGAAPELVRQQDLDTSRPQPNNFWLSYQSLRPPTGAEMKLTGHLTASCGGSGLLLYLLRNPPDGGSGPNGGIMTHNGARDSMYHTTFVRDNDGNQASATMWTGFKERYDTVRSLIPVLRTYGTALIHAKYIGDWLASELLLAPDSTRARLPFIASSIRSSNDKLEGDRYAPAREAKKIELGWPFEDAYADTTNRTFVHISVWVDTLGGRSDTMLYIINMRTDDSYGTTEMPSTMDRRYISLQLNRSHTVMDMLDTRSRSNSKLRTPFVGVPNINTLQVRLLPGDGVLVKLL